MKIIYRYIFKELILPVIFGIAAFTGIFVGTSILFRVLEFYNRYGVELITLVKLFFLELPSVIVITLPMATLLGVIITYGRLSSDSEITAFRAGGISIYRLVFPALVVGLLMTVLTLAINEYAAPWANFQNDQIRHQIRYGKKLPRTQKDLMITNQDGSGRPDFFLYASLFDGESGELKDVLYQVYKEGKPDRIIEADKAYWNGNQWKFVKGKITYLKAGERIPQGEFKEWFVKGLVYGPRKISNLDRDIDDMNIGQLKEHIKIRAAQGKDVRELWIDFYDRFSIPFANFIFALLAAALGIQPQRSSGSATGMGLSIIVIFAYYTMMTVSRVLGTQGILTPFLASWIQNFIFLIIGGVMLYRIGNK